MSPVPYTTLISRLWRHLGPRRRRQYTLLMVLVLLSAVAEIVSLGAVVPFIAVLASPETLYSQPWMAGLANRLGIMSANELIVPLTAAFCVAAVTAGAFRVLVSFATTRLSFATGAELSVEVYRRTLYQPYSIQVQKSSNDLISGVTGKVGRTILGALQPIMVLLSSVFLILAITSTLVLIDPVPAISAMAGFAICYVVVSRIARRRLARNSVTIAAENTTVVKALQEGVGGIRDVLLDGNQSVYVDAYRDADRRWRLAQGNNVFIAQSPRFVIEALAMIMIAFLALALSGRDGGMREALPVLGALTFGAQRMLPVLQQAYAAWSNIVGSRDSFRDVIDLLDQPLPEGIDEDVQPLTIRDKLRVEDVSFRYSPDDPVVLREVSLDIERGQRVGFVGTTGSGKSTLLDLIMGLLTPASGRITVDGELLQGKTIRAWQRSIAHVPQAIFLADATLAENIALGTPCDEIDMGRVRRAASAAQLEDLIASDAAGLSAKVGERGVRLSGGQRQRIAIARALYKRARVLVLDEATSALDSGTEQSIMNEVMRLGDDITILMIAHRVSTLKDCDKIVRLENGEVVASGPYSDISSGEPVFQSTFSSVEAADG